MIPCSVCKILKGEDGVGSPKLEVKICPINPLPEGARGGFEKGKKPHFISSIMFHTFAAYQS